MWAFPRSLSLQSFIDAWTGTAISAGLGPNFLNSILVVVPASFISTVIDALNGYVLSKWKFRGADIIFALMLFGMFIPYQGWFYKGVGSLE